MVKAIGSLPITALVATKNEAANIAQCVRSLGRAERVLVVDSGSTDGTCALAIAAGAEVIQFRYAGGYPKKRQWALDTLALASPWIFLVDADEVIPDALWDEITAALADRAPDAFLVTKGFHFMGREFRHGGFSHSAVLLFRNGRARFERLVSGGSLDMEVHERLIVDGSVGRLSAPLIHHDFKGLEAYIDRHNKYSSWEAEVRHTFRQTGTWGEDTIRPGWWRATTQERRRFLKELIIRFPFEPSLWFAYHYFFRLGLLEGVRGLIASQIRWAYISQVRAKLFELEARTKAAQGGDIRDPIGSPKNTDP